MSDLKKMPHIPFPIEAPEDGSAPGDLWAFPCACGALEDITLLFLRDVGREPVVEEKDNESLVACIKTSLAIYRPFAPLASLLNLQRYGDNLFLDAVSSLIELVDSIPGIPMRLIGLLCGRGWLNASFCTIFGAEAAGALVPWLRKMDISCVQNQSEDGHISLDEIPLFLTEIPLIKLLEYLYRGSARFHADLCLFRDGQSSLDTK